MATGSHTIPRFYLEQFSSPSKRKGGPGRVWVYERNKEPDCRGTTVQGRENGYFGRINPDGSLEESFETRLAKLEDQCNSVLASAKYTLFDWQSSSYRSKIAFYVSLLFQRATQTRNVNILRWENIQREFSEAVADDEYVSDLALHFSAKTNKLITIDEMRAYLRQSSEKMHGPSEAKNEYLDKVLFHTEIIKNYLLAKQWQVWRAPNTAEFITSDNPVVTFIRLGNGDLHPGWGFRRPGVVVAFPLGPTACLAMGVSGPESVTMDAADVMTLNELVIRLCDRFVYSKGRSDQIQEIVDRCAGAARYGVTAFTAVGLEIPSVKDFVRRNLGLEPRNPSE